MPALASDAPAPQSASLTTPQLKQISTYIDILLHWNARINLTAVRRPEDIVTRHFGESLFAAHHLFPPSNANTAASNSSTRVGTAVSAVPPSVSEAPENPPEHTAHVIDLGAGPGFPGIPIKIWAPTIHLTLIESNHKKVTFLREITRAVTLTDVNVFPGRAEDFPVPRPAAAQVLPAPPPSPHRPADVVTLRAVEHFSTILAVAAKLLVPAGKLALLIGEAQAPSAMKLLPTFQWLDPAPIPMSRNRLLLIGSPQVPEQ